MAGGPLSQGTRVRVSGAHPVEPVAGRYDRGKARSHRVQTSYTAINLNASSAGVKREARRLARPDRNLPFDLALLPFGTGSGVGRAGTTETTRSSPLGIAGWQAREGRPDRLSE